MKMTELESQKNKAEAELKRYIDAMPTLKARLTELKNEN
jgi:hypothetical protein